ncbi:MAG: MBL fold metallo-hydrolase, partial [Candidatus Dormibacteraeota bacterium]|nr:MBL fold metallo-hydrolase [Candidatus Dormibacteraeota bacterium]
MRVHHLDCCTMCPVGGRRLSNELGYLVAHCLLLETDKSGLVLVDTGIGLADTANPAARLGGPFNAIVRPRADAARTALRQVEALGFVAGDVRHIIPTHLDVDHAGGLPDFPDATVHVHAVEKSAALTRSRVEEKQRYRPGHFSHGPKWSVYEATSGEPWFGFPAVRSLAGLPEEILAIPLPGHTRGHAAIAVQSASTWLLHAGDAYFHHSVTDNLPGRPPVGLRVFEKLVAMERGRLASNHARLQELARDHRREVRVFSAHDPTEFLALAAVGTSP